MFLTTYPVQQKQPGGLISLLSKSLSSGDPSVTEIPVNAKRARRALKCIFEGGFCNGI
jgi:hypothetical protein